MTTESRATRTRPYVPLIVSVMAAVGVIDQILKQTMVTVLTPGEAVYLIGDWFRLYLLFNPGAAFSMGQNSTWIFTTIQLVFVVGALLVAPRIRDKWEALGIALIAGGALGNLIDRLFRDPGFWFGHVVDYISIGSFAVFNVADIAINVGVAVFVLSLFLGDKDEDNDEDKDGGSNE